ncbi:MAG: transposase [Solirubrobacteraceae bacterium]
MIRRDALEKTIGELIPGSPWEQTVARLRCLRGIDTLSAVGLCAEVGEVERFQKAGQLMSYVGLTPSEDTSGEKRRLGSITKTGSRHARRLLVEAAWHYRRAPAKGHALRRRQAGQPATSSRSPGRVNAACTTSGNGSTLTAASAARSSQSPSRANSAGSAGRSPTPTDLRTVHHVG